MKRFEQLAFGAGFILLVWMISRLGLHHLLAALARMSWGILAVLALYGVTAFTNTLGWRATMPKSARVAPWPLFGFLLAGDAINSVTPSAVVGGELIRLSLLRHRMPLVPAAASVTLAAAAQFVAQILFVLIGLPLALDKTLTRPMRAGYACLIVLAAFGGAVAFSLARRGHPFERLHATLVRRLPVRLRPPLDASPWKALDETIAGAIRDRPSDLALSVGFFLIGWTIGVAEVALVLSLLGTRVGLGTAAAIEMLAVIIDTVLFFIPGRIGTQEAGKYGIFYFLSLDPGTGLTLGLVKRLREIVWAFVGLAVLGFRQSPRHILDAVGSYPQAAVRLISRRRNDPRKGEAMRNRQIPRAEWKQFFSEFNRRHEHELASVSLTGENIGAQHIASDLRFEGFVADESGTHISIALGGAPAANLDHPIDGPAGVWVEQDDEGREVAVEIESAGGATTILEFGEAARAWAQKVAGSAP